MMRRVFLVSRYEGLKNKYHQFHFIGFYNGHYIKKVYVNSGNFEKNQDYVLALDVVACNQNSIFAKLVKSKKLF